MKHAFFYINNNKASVVSLISLVNHVGSSVDGDYGEGSALI